MFYFYLFIFWQKSTVLVPHSETCLVLWTTCQRQELRACDNADFILKEKTNSFLENLNLCSYSVSTRHI